MIKPQVAAPTNLPSCPGRSELTVTVGAWQHLDVTVKRLRPTVGGCSVTRHDSDRVVTVTVTVTAAGPGAGRRRAGLAPGAAVSA